MTNLKPTKMKTANFKIGQSVKKILPKNDYTFGRIGVIVDLGWESKRIRVRWMNEANGNPTTTCNAKPGNGVRTWVAATNIELI